MYILNKTLFVFLQILLALYPISFFQGNIMAAKSYNHNDRSFDIISPFWQKLLSENTRIHFYRYQAY